MTLSLKKDTISILIESNKKMYKQIKSKIESI